MALFPCSQCKREISDEAKTCPNCGAKVRPLKKPMSGTMKLLLVFLGIGFVTIVAIQSKTQEESRIAEQKRAASVTPEQRENERAAKALRDAQLQVAGAATMTLKKSMKDPEAFTLRSLVVKPNGTACYEYRAKNGFGAVFPSSAVRTPKGTFLMQERDGNSFVALWNKECTAVGGDEIADVVNKVLAR